MAREQAPAFQFYPRDFVGDLDVAAMTLEQAGAYAVLLSYAWLKNGLPNDFPKLARALHVSGKRFDGIWQAIGEKFTLAVDGRLRNPRQEREREKQEANRASSSEHGEKGARARWNKTPGQCPSNARALPNDGSSSSSSSASSSSSESTAATPPSTPVENPVQNPTTPSGFGGLRELAPFAVVSALVRSVLAEGQDWEYAGGEADLMDELKTRCAKTGLGYDTELVRKALDSERVKAKHRRSA